MTIQSSKLHCLPNTRLSSSHTNLFSGNGICTDNGLFATELCGDICCDVVGTVGDALGELVGRDL